MSIEFFKYDQLEWLNYQKNIGKASKFYFQPQYLSVWWEMYPPTDSESAGSCLAARD